MKIVLFVVCSLLLHAGLTQPEHYPIDISSPGLKMMPASQMPVVSPVDSSHHFFWDNQCEHWFLNSRVLNTLNQEGMPLIELTLWDQSGWVNHSRKLYTYDDAGLVTVDLEQYWYTSYWGDGPRHVMKYDAAGFLVDNVFQGWNGNTWSNYERRTYQYNTSHQLLEWIEFRWYMDWVFDRRHTNTFDAQQHVIKQLVEVYLADSVLIPEYQILYTYAPDGLLVSQVTQRFQMDQWQDESQLLYVYDEHQHRIILRQQLLNEEEEWEDSWQRLYSYDDLDQLITYEVQSKDTSAWRPNNRHVYTYDDQQHLISDTYQWWANKWVNRDSTHYFRSKVTSVFTQTHNLESVIYPNPSSGMLTIDFKDQPRLLNSICIFNASGILVDRILFKRTGDNDIDVSHLQPGVYFLNVETNLGVITKQFVRL